VTNLERGDLASALAGSAIASGAGVASVSGATSGAIAALAAVGAMINSTAMIINPAIRANALSEGNIMVLNAEGDYLLCLTGSGITRVSRSKITPCGARLAADVNSAIASTNRILVGLRPSAVDSARLQPADHRSAAGAVSADVVRSINSETAGSPP
jgi:hypothetical protein